MIKSRYLYGSIVALIALFLIMLVVLPRTGIETKNDSFSYETRIFNESKVTTVNIEIEEDDWADLLENAADEEFKEASVTINGTTINNVALRTKGNSSLSSVVSSDSERYSFKIDFDHYDSTQSLYGLKKLNLNNNFSDTTQMKEFVSYELMEKMGLPTPAHSYMYVTVNGEDYGLYLGVEQIDETFLANNFGSNDGFLYKPDGTGSDLKWISDSISDYTGIELKTNEKDADDSKIIEMLDIINNGGDLESVLEVDELLRYFAMNTALVSLDSYQGTMKHNYYLYEEDGKFSIIPWDYNMAFGGFGVGGMGGGGMGNFGGQMGDQTTAPANNDATQSDETNERPQMPGNAGGDNAGGNMMMGGMGGDLMSDDTINFSVSEPVSGTSLADRPLLNVLLENNEYRAQYEAYLEEIATDYLTEDAVQEITNNLAAILTTYVEADPTKFSTTEDFLEGVSGEESLPAFAAARSESILMQLSGELVVESSATTNTQPNSQGNEATQNQVDESASSTEGNDGNAQGGFSQGQNGAGQTQEGVAQNGSPPQMQNGQQGGTPPGNGAQGDTDTTDNQNGFDPSQMPNSENGEFDPSQVPDFENGEFDPSQMQNGGQGGNRPSMNGSELDTSDGKIDMSVLITSTITFILLILALIFAFRYKRRK